MCVDSPPREGKSVNINYIRAAIEEATGVRLTLEQTLEYLLDEEMITPSKAKNMIFPGYNSYYKDTHVFKEEGDMKEIIKNKEIKEGDLIPVDILMKINNG